MTGGDTVLLTLPAARRASVGGVLVPLPLSVSPVAAVWKNQLYVLAASGNVVHAAGADGGDVLYVFRGLQGPRVTAEGRQTILEDVSNNNQEVLNALTDLPFPNRAPAFDKLLVDYVGRLWLRRSTLDSNDGRSWIILDDSRELCQVETPAGFNLASVEQEGIVGMVRNQMDAPSISFHEMHPR